MKLIFLGPPGAGKGTIAKQISEKYDIPHISTGDLFRKAIEEKTILGRKVKAIIDQGGLVPDDLTIELVKNRLMEGDAQKGFILDGFPRTVPQASGLDSFCCINKCICFDINDEEIIRRLSGRRVCSNCGTTYHIEFMPPMKPRVCDKCGGKLITRSDDTVEAIKHRLNVYYEQTEPLIEYYKQEDLLATIDATPKPEVVFQAIEKQLFNLM